jgi:hypothetical protein
MPLSDLQARKDKILSYLHPDEDLARKLAQFDGDIPAQREVLVENSSEEFLQNIFSNTEYEPFVYDAVDYVYDEFPDIVQEIRDRNHGINTGSEKYQQEKARKYKSKTKKGTEYSRDYKRWSQNEKDFISSRKEKHYDTKTIVKDYKAYFGKERSDSSIKTKIYRS